MTTRGRSVMLFQGVQHSAYVGIGRLFSPWNCSWALKLVVLVGLLKTDSGFVLLFFFPFTYQKQKQNYSELKMGKSNNTDQPLLRFLSTLQWKCYPSLPFFFPLAPSILSLNCQINVRPLKNFLALSGTEVPA